MLETQTRTQTVQVAGILAWPWEWTSEVLLAWRRWAGAAPAGTVSVARVLQPAPGSGVGYVTIEVAGGPSDELLEPLRALDPVVDTFAGDDFAALGVTASRSEEVQRDERLLGNLTDAALRVFAAATGPRSDSPLGCVELHDLGGAFLMAARGTADGACTPKALDAYLRTLSWALDPWDTSV